MMYMINKKTILDGEKKKGRKKKLTKFRSVLTQTIVAIVYIKDL